MSFKHLASTMIVRGLRVMPSEPGKKTPATALVPNGSKDASNDLLTIAQWDKALPEAGVGVVAEPETVFLLDFDEPTAIPPDILEPFFCVETGSREPDWNGRGKRHYYFKQNAETRQWGNKPFKYKDAEGKSHESWSYRGSYQYVIGPGSIHPDTGLPYVILNDVTIVEPPETVLSWLRPQMIKATAKESRTDRLDRPLHKDFTPEKFLDHYGLKYRKDGDSYHVHFPGQGCPAAGRVHEAEKGVPRAVEQCTFLFGAGRPPAFKCLSGGCDGQGFKDAVTALLKRNPKLKAFKVWEKKEEKRSLIVICGRGRERKQMDFVWRPYIPSGELTHFAGVSGFGKSPVTVDLAARVTAGRDWPDLQKNTHGPRSVLLMNLEDDLDNTILPRLDLGGGDDSKFFYVSGVRFEKESATGVDEDGKEYTVGVALDRDMRLLEETARSIEDLGMIIVDPITNYLGKKRMNSEEEVRSILTPLAALARELRVAVMTVGHLNRREAGTDPIHRMMGAAAFAGVARSICMAGRDPEDEDVYAKVMVVARNVAGGLKDGLRYKTYEKGVSYPDGKIINAVGIEWRGKTTATAEDVADPETKDEKSKIGEAAEFLRQLLSKGKLPARTCINEMTTAGFDLAKLNSGKVRKRAKVKTTKAGKDSEWFLSTSRQDEPGDEAPEIPDQELRFDPDEFNLPLQEETQ